MLKITLRGTPYEIGFQHGQSLKPLVNGIVGYLLHSDQNWQEKEIEETINRLNESAPELLAEMIAPKDINDTLPSKICCPKASCPNKP
ncbi:hypothetical protein [Paenibacillus sp. SAFN-117]|uniref:hypothetical protein n=1 Tax=Paenibacillus sp. SAFN-117 TaxID=3436860 RepID=UPI003F7D2BAD